MRFGLVIALIFFGVVFMANGSKFRNYNNQNVKRPTRPRAIRGYKPEDMSTAIGVGFGKRDRPDPFPAFGVGFGKRDGSDLSTALGVGYGKRDGSDLSTALGVGYGKRDGSDLSTALGVGFGKRDGSSEISNLNRREKVLMSLLHNFPQSLSSEWILREMKTNPAFADILTEIIINNENGQTPIGEQFQPEGTIFEF